MFDNTEFLLLTVINVAQTDRSLLDQCRDAHANYCFLMH